MGKNYEGLDNTKFDESAKEITVENKYYEKADFIIIIDHHPRDKEKWGNIYIVKEHAAAAAEIVADILLSFKTFNIPLIE